MTGDDKRFAEVKERLARKQYLEALIPSLQEQYSDLLAKVQELREKKAKEQKDVDRLEQGSLAAFFLNVVGKREEKITEEQKEAYMAAVKCDAAEKELYEIESRLNRAEEELIGLQDCEKEYETLLQEKMEAIAEKGLPVTEELLQLEQSLFEAEKQIREVKEAVCEGQKADELVRTALEKLENADRWSTYDLFGGGVIADLAKHSNIDSAQESIEKLQVQLRNFKTELTDVRVHAEISIDIDDMLQFADYVFDGFIMDYEVKKRIEDAILQVETTRDSITEVLQKLKQLETEYGQKINEYKEHMRRLITTTEV